VVCGEHGLDVLLAALIPLIGYARTSTARQELASQLQALRRAECHKIFQEQISTRVKVRPELIDCCSPRPD
jgi:DNA invertase Pin-like site-specific DNA recombinase